MLFVPASNSVIAQSDQYAGALVELDKIHYSWSDFLSIYVVAPDFNSDSEQLDHIGGKIDSRITISSSNGKQLDFYKLEETGVDTGVFWGLILLTGFFHDTDGDGRDNPIMLESVDDDETIRYDFVTNLTGSTSGKGPNDGNLKAKPGDTITVTFSEKYSGSTNTHEAIAYVNWVLPELEFKPYLISPNEPVTVTVVDQDMNLSVFSRDSFFVNIYTDSDVTGFQLEVTETETSNDYYFLHRENTTGKMSGIFEGEIVFTDCSPVEHQKGICTPHPSAKVLAKPGDTITLEYNDYTLPWPDFVIGEYLTFAATTKMSGSKATQPEIPKTEISEPIVTPAITPEESSTIPSSFKKYVDRKERFSLGYPGDWLKGADGLGHVTSEIAISDKADWNIMVQMFFNDGDIPGDRTDYQILKQMEYNDSEACEDNTFASDDRICYDYKVLDSYTMKTFDGEKMYFVKASYTLEFDDPGYPGEYPMISIFSLVYDKNDSWEVNVESDDFAFEENSDEIINILKSLSLDPNSQQKTNPTKSITLIPDWIKNNAGWWASDLIPDLAFIQGIQHLIKEGIIVIPSTEISDSSGSQEVPSWIKNNAGWWADGQIDDNSFVSGIQYLVKVGIIQVG